MPPESAELALLLGRSRPMKDLRATVGRVAPHECSVLLRGETGTGKELVARAIHHESTRRSGPFVPLNCAAIPESLAESQLFGHEAGAFSGSRGRHRGVFEQADGGTLFLDEVAELSTPVQPKLLRSLQEREVVRVGSELAAQPIQVDVRVIAASHQDLLELAGVGRFRSDLYYRLCEYTIHVPPLRVRERDVLELARHALAHTGGPQCRLGRDAEHLLLSHPWPGNVRELQAVVIAASIDARSGRIGASEIKRHLRTSAAQPSGSVTPGPAVVAAGDGRDARILELLSERGASSMGELVSCSGIPRGSVRHLLAKLTGAGQIAHTGEGRARRYLLPERTGADGQQPGGGGRHSAALSRLRSAGALSRRDYVALTGVSPRTANRDLIALVEAGLIRANGEHGRAAGYLLASGEGETSD